MLLRKYDRDSGALANSVDIRLCLADNWGRVYGEGSHAMKRDFLRTFYKPTHDMAIEIIRAQRRIDGKWQEEYEVPGPIIEHARDDIALRIWGFMAGLARVLTVPDGRQDAYLHCDDTTLRRLAVDLQRDLALPEYDNSVELGNSILQDFLNWLRVDQGGKYKAAWGQMGYDGKGISFSDVYNPVFLTGDYEKAGSARRSDASSLLSAYSGSSTPTTPSVPSAVSDPAKS